MASRKILFSRAAVDEWKPAESGKRDYYYDTRQPSLRLDVTPSGRKTFQVYVKHGGRPIVITLGRFNPDLAESIELPKDCTHTEYLARKPDLNVKCARALAARVLIDVKSGVNPTDIKRAKRSEITLGQLFEEYVSRHLIPEKKQVAPARGYFEVYVGAIPPLPPDSKRKQRVKLPGGVNWQNRKISSITTDDIQRLISGLATKGGSVNNANRVLTLLKSMYARAKDWKIYNAANPTDGVSKYRTKSRERFLQSDELPRFFESLAMEPNKDIRDYVVLSLLTGARKSNVLSMRWADLNLDRAVWTLPDELTKNGDPLTLPLVPETIEILRGRKPVKAATFVFPSHSKSGRLENSRNGWVRVLDRDEIVQLAERIRAAGGEFEYSFEDQESPTFDHLGVLLKKARAQAEKMEIDTNGARLPDLRPHDLRRTLGSWQANAGTSLLMIGRSLGHKSEASTAIYSRLNIDPIRQSVATATRSILEAAGVSKSGEVTSIEDAKKQRKNSA